MRHFLTVISLFCGAGGSSLGYQWAGFKELLAIDFDKNAHETFKMNFDCPAWLRDVKTVTAKEVMDFCKIKEGELDILDGSPPCQGFSTAGKRQVFDDRNDLFKEYVRLIEGLKPKVFVMENVSGMIKGKMKGKFKEILLTLKALPYQVKCKLMNAKYYQVPQSRERLIFIGVRNDLGVEPSFPIPGKKLITVREALKGLTKQKVPNLSACFVDVVPKMKQGQTVNDIMKQGKHFQTRRIYNNKPCPTIGKLIGGVGFGSHIHPTENRALSITEMKILSSFPVNFKMDGSYQEQKARIGNSVMPKFMQAIAENIKINVLDKHYVRA